MISSFKDTVLSVNKSFAKRIALEILQVNLGNMCNQRCVHCHIGASPEGDKVMSKVVMDGIVGFLTKKPGLILDITGGCPELNPNFKYLVKESRPHVKQIMVRSNLTVIFGKRMEDLPRFYKENKIKLICSLPCYTEENVDKQRGKGVFAKSVRALRFLNGLGYAHGGDLELDLVYNPGGAFLPGNQATLEKDYKIILEEQYRVQFNHLRTITNAPINRFKQYLEASDSYDEYMELLVDSFNRDVAGNIMCRSLLSVGWDGVVCDCDFNQALGLVLKDENGKAMKIGDLDPQDLEGKEITFEDHCYSCTAGAGSSCSGALKERG